MKYLALLLLMSLQTLAAKEWQGALFPAFKLQNQHGDWIQSDQLTKSWTAYYFYPKDNTPGCSIEAENFSKSYVELKQMGLEIVGISLDDVESHAEFARDYNVSFHLLADVDKQLSKQLDLVNYLPWPHTRRETFLVDNNGNIVKHYASVDPKTHVNQLKIDYLALIEKK